MGGYRARVLGCVGTHRLHRSPHLSTPHSICRSQIAARAVPRVLGERPCFAVPLRQRPTGRTRSPAPLFAILDGEAK